MDGGAKADERNNMFGINGLRTVKYVEAAGRLFYSEKCLLP